MGLSLTNCCYIFFISLSVFCQLASFQEVDTDSFTNFFSECSLNNTEFDNCIKDALNGVRIYFKSGVPDLGLPPFDPFHAKEVLQRRGGPGFNYKLKLKNVQEKGWTDSMVTKFKSNIPRNMVKYTQFFPEKSLEGDYEFEGQLMANNMTNKGTWNLTLYNLVQTTTISAPPGAKSLKVYVDVQMIGDLDLHISNLLRGRALMEGMLDRMINTAWRPGFRVIRPLINDLVSTAFTGIFTNAFKDFDFSRIIPGLRDEEDSS